MSRLCTLETRKFNQIDIHLQKEKSQNLLKWLIKMNFFALQKNTQMFFEHIDLNKDGVIDFEEYVKGCQVVSRETIRVSKKYHSSS